MFVELSKRILPLLSPLTAGFALLALGAAPVTTPNAAEETPEAVARAVVKDLTEGRTDAVAARFDSRMAAALPADRLRQVWLALGAQAGAFRHSLAPRSESVGGATVVTVPLEFEKMTLDLRLTVGAGGKVAGMFFAPAAAPPAAWSAPAYADPKSFTETEVTVGREPWSLPGTLTLPAGKAKVPAVVLVHGSGPHDRNETIGPIRPFQDLAWGLASRGVAVLRYEKRTKARPERLVSLKSLTVREETMDDARAAVALLRGRPEVDAARVVLVGHSLGGTLAPRIAKEEPGLAAIVILAGATRPIPDLMLEQSEYLASLGGAPDAETRKQLDALKADVAKARALRPGDEGAPAVLNAPASYWIDLNGYDPAAAAASLAIPLLVLQGGRDYQVTAPDLDRWKKALSGRKTAVIRVYPELNHLFVEGSGRSTPAEYERAGHVDARAVEAIAAFVKGTAVP